MNLEPQSAGIALICDRDGIIVQVLRDELGLATAKKLGRPLADLLDSESVPKAELFFTTLRDQQAAIDWPMHVELDGKIVALVFSGVAVDEKLAIVASAARLHVHRFYLEMSRILTEQTQLVRALAKEYHFSPPEGE